MSHLRSRDYKSAAFKDDVDSLRRVALRNNQGRKVDGSQQDVQIASVANEGPWAISDDGWPVSVEKVKEACKSQGCVREHSRRWCNSHGCILDTSDSRYGNVNEDSSGTLGVSFCMKLGGCYRTLEDNEQIKSFKS